MSYDTHTMSACIPSRRATQRGFTLIELMVVMAILGVLAALVVPNLMSRADEAKVQAAKTDMTTIAHSLKLYRLDNRRLPTAEQGLLALVKRPETGPVANEWRKVLDKLPTDPWGGAFLYKVPGRDGADFEIISLGADGAPGGEGFDADISSAD